MDKNVVIADDSKSILDVVSFTIESEGFKVLQGSDGQIALDHFDGKEISFVVTDLHMPNMDGIELIKEIRKKEKYKYVPILLLTTESRSEKKIEAKEAGATGWITKPFVPENLKSIINKLVR